ncbi:MAG: hypothetical protein OZSIB_1691 [Candidatus Ozemobacter sibiricus]|jgi:hypothetical protein|uniref:Uncharacterized protein n=1 Tax=Candidatus Ozemobacter sibiricus TaxID=2268124 RepID=A0A367ZJ81_9BACT|nr:MAG: hypothetical protein OZSIB_1691 [Candidatus Ozemobacter sibiricus]
MLIEIFTDGRVLIDGQDAGPGYQPEHVLLDYLTNPKGFLEMRRKQKHAA